MTTSLSTNQLTYGLIMTWIKCILAGLNKFKVQTHFLNKALLQAILFGHIKKPHIYYCRSL